jgi:poly[ADP-ribose] polymerase 16
MEYVHCETAAPAPNLIFQLVGNRRGASEMRWQEVSSGHKTLYAYHGSRLDNFHSILHYGLQQHLNKVSISFIWTKTSLFKAAWAIQCSVCLTR